VTYKLDGNISKQSRANESAIEAKNFSPEKIYSSVDSKLKRGGGGKVRRSTTEFHATGDHFRNNRRRKYSIRDNNSRYCELKVF